MIAQVILQAHVVRFYFYFFLVTCDLFDVSAVLKNFLWRDFCFCLILEKQENKGRMRYLLGESLGGAVALLLHRKKPDFWDGAVLVAPMCKVTLYIMSFTFGLSPCHLSQITSFFPKEQARLVASPYIYLYISMVFLQNWIQFLLLFFSSLFFIFFLIFILSMIINLNENKS
jgi:hypothetical protein